MRNVKQQQPDASETFIYKHSYTHTHSDLQDVTAQPASKPNRFICITANKVVN